MEPCQSGSYTWNPSLGNASELVEYKSGFYASVSVAPTNNGLVICAVNGQRLYTNNKWPNPVVLKIENVTFNAPKRIKEEKSKIEGAK